MKPANLYSEPIRDMDTLPRLETVQMHLGDDKLQELVERIVRAAHPVRIILFGSGDRGCYSASSDIDVLVVVEDGIHRRKTSQVIYQHLLGFGLPVDVVVATTKDIDMYRNSQGLVYREALRDGIELYAA